MQREATRHRCPRAAGNGGRTRVAFAAVLLLLLLAVPGCAVGGNGPRHLDWLYTVPRGYMGFLAVRFTCPGGPSLLVIRNVAQVAFAPDGVACVGEPFTPWQGTLAAQDTGHRFIPVRNTVASLRPPGDEQGYALFAAATGTRNGYTYMAAWVGETRLYDQLRATDAFDRTLDTFLATAVDGRRATPGLIP